MSVTLDRSAAVTGDHVVEIRRRTIDSVLVAFGALVTVVLIVAGFLLNWGNAFAHDYVGDELSKQQIFFPPAESLEADGRTDLLPHAGQQVLTGDDAEAYASYIDGHLAKTADGQTYAQLGGPERAAKAEVTAAKEASASAEEIAALQAKADTISNQRNTLFKGETLRGLLLSTYAWSKVGTIAGIAAWVAWGAAAVMAVLTALGVAHLSRMRR